jgi:hypothetical protein
MTLKEFKEKVNKIPDEYDDYKVKTHEQNSCYDLNVHSVYVANSNYHKKHNIKEIIIKGV